MGAKESAAMKTARELVTGPRGLNQSQAAKETGLTRGAISKAKWYREFKATTEGKK
jgi:predicted transcriptional regulator